MDEDGLAPSFLSSCISIRDEFFGCLCENRKVLGAATGCAYCAGASSFSAAILFNVLGIVTNPCIGIPATVAVGCAFGAPCYCASILLEEEVKARMIRDELRIRLRQPRMTRDSDENSNL